MLENENKSNKSLKNEQEDAPSQEVLENTSSLENDLEETLDDENISKIDAQKEEESIKNKEMIIEMLERMKKNEEMIQVFKEREISIKNKLKEDMDNLEKMYKNRAEQFELNMIKKFIAEISEIMNAFDRSNDVTSFDALSSGMKMIKKMFINTLSKLDIESISIKEGDDFSSDRHEAITFSETKNKEEDGKIVKILWGGYSFKEIVIKHAGVEVSKFVQ